MTDDKTIKIHASSIDGLFKDLNDSFIHIENVMKSDLELSYFYLDGKIEIMRTAMEKFNTENNLKK